MEGFLISVGLPSKVHRACPTLRLLMNISYCMHITLPTCPTLTLLMNIFQTEWMNDHCFLVEPLHQEYFKHQLSLHWDLCEVF